MSGRSSKPPVSVRTARKNEVIGAAEEAGAQLTTALEHKQQEERRKMEERLAKKKAASAGVTASGDSGSGASSAASTPAQGSKVGSQAEEGTGKTKVAVFEEGDES
jgi:hypothetical protein